MENSQLYTELKILIENKKGFTLESKEILVRFKNQGGSQEEAIEACEKLRNFYSENEILEDNVLDMLDIITGWCSPDMKVWS